MTGLTGGTTMLPAWMVNATSTSFLSRSTSNGSANLVNVAATFTNSTSFTGVTVNDIVDSGISGTTNTVALAANTSIYALRLMGTTNISNNTLTILGSANRGSGLISSTGTITGNLVFNNEADIYVAAGNLTLAATMTVNGSGDLVKSGPGGLVIATTNAGGFNGAFYVNSGTLQFNNVVSANSRPIIMNGGSVTLSTSGVYNSELRVLTDLGQLNAGGAVLPTITFGNGNAGDPSYVALHAISNTLTVNGSMLFNTNAWIDTAADMLVTGLVSQAGGARSLSKFGAGALFLDNSANSYTGGTIVNGGLLATHMGGTPFGTGQVTVNAGGGLRLGTPVGNAIIVRSDRNSLAFLGLAFAFSSLPGNVSFDPAGGAYDAFIGWETPDVIGTLDMATLTPAGNAFLMSGSNGIFNGTLLAGAGNKFRLGGAVAGGNNIFTVNSTLTGVGNGLIIGALSAGDGGVQADSILLQNGETSIVVLNGANTFGGGAWINGNGTSQSQVTLGNNQALGTGTVSSTAAGSTPATPHCSRGAVPAPSPTTP